jgi:VIT1/CCC1 family predicted Fe2+/Mn2+ transporter
MVLLILPSASVPGVSVATRVCLALLGAIGARPGGANVLEATLRVAFRDALAMALTAGIGAVFGTVVRPCPCRARTCA